MRSVSEPTARPGLMRLPCCLSMVTRGNCKNFVHGSLSRAQSHMAATAARLSRPQRHVAPAARGGGGDGCARSACRATRPRSTRRAVRPAPRSRRRGTPVAALVGAAPKSGRLHERRHRGGQPRCSPRRFGRTGRAGCRRAARRARPSTLASSRGHRFPPRCRRADARRCETAWSTSTWLRRAPGGGERRPWSRSRPPTTRPASSSPSPTSRTWSARPGGLLHVDAVQAAGKLPLDIGATSGADVLTLSAHKLGGPEGRSARSSSARTGVEIGDAPGLRGGGQERGLRAGTENVAAIAGFGAAAGMGPALPSATRRNAWRGSARRRRKQASPASRRTPWSSARARRGCPTPSPSPFPGSRPRRR